MGLTDDQRRLQLQIAAITVTRLAATWRILDPDDIPGTIPPWIDLALPIVEDMHTRSAAAGRAYYRAIRAQKVGASALGTLPVPGFVAPAAQRSLIVTGPLALVGATRRGRSLESASVAAMVSMARAGSRHALLGGRETITQAVRSDRRARGWRRATGPNPCEFCILQASRGAVYSEATVDFAAHANCACIPEPAFD